MKKALVMAAALALVAQDAAAQRSLDVYKHTSGQWMELSDGSGIYVPKNAPSYLVDGVPYVYMYRRGAGWRWYASPWGPGPFVYDGAWRAHPWPYGRRSWRPQYFGVRPYGGYYELY